MCKEVLKRKISSSSKNMTNNTSIKVSEGNYREKSVSGNFNTPNMEDKFMIIIHVDVRHFILFSDETIGNGKQSAKEIFESKEELNYKLYKFLLG
jgi:hypothetical protein